MLDFLRDNATWLFYMLVFVLMMRMHMGHGRHGAHGGRDRESSQAAGDLRSTGTKVTNSDIAESRNTSDGGHAH